MRKILEKSGKSQGISSEEKSGNPGTDVGRYFESGDGMIDVAFLWIPAT